MKMSFITFNLNKNLCYAIAYWIIELAIRIPMLLNPNLFKLLEKDFLDEYYFVILLNISDLLGGFIALYTNISSNKTRLSKHSQDNKFINNNIEIIIRKRSSVPKSQTYYYKIILICLLDYLSRSAYFIFFQFNKEATQENIPRKVQADIINNIDILFRFFFSNKILKIKIFKHHCLAVIIIFIGLVIITSTGVISFLFFYDNVNIVGVKIILEYLAIFLIRGILFPFEDTLIKKLFIEDYLIPEYLMFIRGLGEWIIILIITPILYFFGWKNDKFSSIFVDDLKKIIAISIIYIWSSFLKAILLLNVIYFFSSQSVSFLIISESVAFSIFEIIHYFMPNNINNIFTLIVEIIVIIIILIR